MAGNKLWFGSVSEFYITGRLRKEEAICTVGIHGLFCSLLMSLRRGEKTLMRFLTSRWEEYVQSVRLKVHCASFIVQGQWLEQTHGVTLRRSRCQTRRCTQRLTRIHSAIRPKQMHGGRLNVHSVNNNASHESRFSLTVTQEPHGHTPYPPIILLTPSVLGRIFIFVLLITCRFYTASERKGLK